MNLREVIVQTLRTLPPASKRRVMGVWAVLTVSALVEAAGLAIWYPVVMLVATPKVAENSPELARLGAWLGTETPRELVLTLLVSAIALSVVVAAIRLAATYASSRVAFSERTDFSVRLLEAYLAQPYEWLVSRNTTDLSREVIEEGPQIVETSLMALFQLYFGLFLSGVLLVGMLLTDPWIALLSLAVLGVMFGGVYRFVKPRMVAVADERIEQTNQLGRRVIEALFAVREARVSPRASNFVAVVAKQQNELGEVACHQELLSGVPGTATEVTARLGILLAILYLLVMGHSHSLALAAAYVMVVVRVAPEVRRIYSQAAALQATVPRLIRFREFLDYDRTPLRLCTETFQLAEAIQLREVRFQYGGREKEVLRGIDLDIPRRSSVALIGETGVGKSTLAGILAGLLVPRSGEMLVDGKALDESSRRAWRNNIGYVPQEVYMIQSTIRGNIALGIPADDVDEERLRAAAAAAGATEFIETLEHGFGCWLQERGASLSGGQRQRIALARALYHDPEVLILDEATSSLDNRTERGVLDALERLAAEKTLVVIAHRLTTVRRCDQICLMEEGRILASGTYEELKRTSPRFAAMIEAGSLLAQDLDEDELVVPLWPEMRSRA